MRVHSVFFLLLSLALIGILAFFPVMDMRHGNLEYKDLIAIQMSAITVLLAALGIGVAALALWGYREFIAKAEQTAKDIAVTAVSNHLSHDIFKQEVRSILAELEALRASEMLKADAPPQPPREQDGAPPIPEVPGGQ